MLYILSGIINIIIMNILKEINKAYYFICFYSHKLFLRLYAFFLYLKLYNLLVISFYVIAIMLIISLIICLLLREIIVRNNDYILSKLNYYTHIFDKENINLIGLWGEDKLLGILSKFGFCKDIDFYQQKCFFIGNKSVRPDYAIILEKNTYLIVDVKTPWIAYKKYIESNNKEEKHRALKEHSKALKRHIKDLSLKNYSEIKESLPFVLMFVPIDDIITDAIKYEADLIYICRKYNVYIVTPNTICMLIDTIKQLLVRGTISKSLIKQQQNLNNIIDSVANISSAIDSSLDISSKNTKELANLKSQLNNKILFKLKELRESVDKNID